MTEREIWMQRPSNNQGWNWKWGQGELRFVGTQERTWCEDQSSFSKTKVKKKKNQDFVNYWLSATVKWKYLNAISDQNTQSKISYSSLATLKKGNNTQI